jgi:hypothetical protein
VRSFHELMMSTVAGSAPRRVVGQGGLERSDSSKDPRDFAHKRFRSVAVGYAEIHRHCERARAD